MDSNADIVSEIEDGTPELLIVNVKKPEQNLLQQIRSVNQVCTLPIIMFTEVDSQNMVDEFIQSGVNSYVVDGLEACRIEPIIGVAMARFGQMQGLKNELSEAKRALEERKLIDKAKGIIMKRKACGEDEAYRALRL